MVSLIHMHLVMIKCSSAVFQPYTHDHRQVKANIQRLLYLARMHTDLESACSETRVEKNRKLVDMLMPILQNELVLYSPCLQDPLILPINGNLSNKCTDSD